MGKAETPCHSAVYVSPTPFPLRTCPARAPGARRTLGYVIMLFPDGK